MLSYIINLLWFCHCMLWIIKILPWRPQWNMWFQRGSQSAKNKKKLETRSVLTFIKFQIGMIRFLVFVYIYIHTNIQSIIIVYIYIYIYIQILKNVSCQFEVLERYIYTHIQRIINVYIYIVYIQILKNVSSNLKFCKGQYTSCF